jgi:hypothetical protein
LEDNEAFQDFYDEEILPPCVRLVSNWRQLVAVNQDISPRSMSLTVWFYYSHFGYMLVNIYQSNIKPQMKIVFQDPTFSLQLLRVIGETYYKGADIGECLSTAYKIKEGDFESWHQEWLRQQKESTNTQMRALQLVIQ